ncbi:MAG: GPR endopeptidase [Deltaproteobacteria bacterium]
MPHSIRTDLALETRELYKKSNQIEVPGVEVETDNQNELSITRVKIKTSEGVEAMGKPIGNYITLEVPELNQGIKEINDKVVDALAKEITRIMNTGNEASVLIVGLGNWNVTPDALGPKVISKIAVTRHLIEYASEYIEKGTRSVSVIAPGVLGITGIETGEIIKGVIEKIKPDVVIAIDALASRKMERISTTIQIADTGISPGSGVGNKRMELNKETLGIPVIAIGIPTVVDAVTLANDTLDLMMQRMMEQYGKQEDFNRIFGKAENGDKMQLIKEVLAPYVGELVVTPKEIDSIVSNISEVVAGGINAALHGSLENAEKYLS